MPSKVQSRKSSSKSYQGRSAGKASPSRRQGRASEGVRGRSDAEMDESEENSFIPRNRNRDDENEEMYGDDENEGYSNRPAQDK